MTGEASARLVFYSAAADAPPSMIRWAFRALDTCNQARVVAVAVMLAAEGDRWVADALEPAVGPLARAPWLRPPSAPPRGVYR